MRANTFVADAHTHLFLEPSRVYRRLLHFTESDLIAAMDRDGIDLALVIARPAEHLRIDELRVLHERTAEAIARHPERLVGSCWAAPRLGQAGLAEVERCLGELRYAGIKLHPSQEQFNIDDDEVVPYAAIARDHGVPITVHTQLAVRGSEPWRMLSLAERFPDVTFVMAHLGGDGGMVQTLAAAKIAAEYPNISVEVSTTVSDPGATYLGPAQILGPERVLFGSDAPVHQAALNLLKLDLVEMPDEWRALISGGNLLRLLRRDAPQRSSRTPTATA
jgi:predicted TIM-barrel fold metal-dependent hydrolase